MGWRTSDETESLQTVPVVSFTAAMVCAGNVVKRLAGLS